MGFVIGKHGGSSISTPGKLELIVGLHANQNRTIDVVSAPGESDTGSIVAGYKFTDLAIALGNRYAFEHYHDIAVAEKQLPGKPSTVGLEKDTLSLYLEQKLQEAYFHHDSTQNLVAETMEKIRAAATNFEGSTVKEHSAQLQYLGEWFSAQNLAGALRAKGKKLVVLDPSDFICLNGDDPLEAKVMLDETIEKFRRWKDQHFDKDIVYIIPGYYGKSLNTGKISLLGRDGTNMTLVLAALGLKPDYCENWTDVRGIFEVSPPKDKKKQPYVEGVNILSEITPDELMELAARLEGKVFQGRALSLLRRAGAFPEIHVKDYAHAGSRGTAIVSNRDYHARNIIALGINEDVIAIRITDPRMSEEPGYLEHTAGVIRRRGGNVRHTCDPETEITYYIDRLPPSHDGLTNPENNLKNDLVRELGIDGRFVDVSYDYSVIGAIGGRLNGDTMFDVLSTLKKNSISFEPYTAGSRTAHYVVVPKSQARQAITALYEQYLRKENKQ